MNVDIEVDGKILEDEVIDLYRANSWSSAEKPDQLIPALRNSHALITACFEGMLVGISNAISDGYLVVYYPHMLVHPKYHGLCGFTMVRNTKQTYTQIWAKKIS